MPPRKQHIWKDINIVLDFLNFKLKGVINCSLVVTIPYDHSELPSHE